MEEACKALPGQCWPVGELPGLAFQMLFSLFVAQKELQLRHYDVKLLNFFLAAPPKMDLIGIYLYIYVCIYIYIHTHTHIYIYINHDVNFLNFFLAAPPNMDQIGMY